MTHLETTSAEDMRVLEIGNYPPPRCGWSVRTAFLVERLRETGARCEVLNIGPSRRQVRPDCVDVQGPFDYLRKLVRFAGRGYRFHVHTNGDSWKGFLVTIGALAVGRLFGPPPALTFHAGLEQRFFPRRTLPYRLLFRVLFGLPDAIVCNSEPVKRAIVGYGIDPSSVHVIPAFSRRYVEEGEISPAPPPEIEAFLGSHSPCLVCYAYYRPEFRLAQLFRVLRSLARDWPDLGLVMVGHLEGDEPFRELAARLDLSDRILFAGDLPHGDFLATLRAADVYVRTHLRDGVSSSVLEALALDTPVVAAENESRPPEALTYPGEDAESLERTLRRCLEESGSPRGDEASESVRAQDTLASEVRVLLSTRMPEETASCAE